MISYARAIALLISTINYSIQDRETDVAKEDLSYIGFEDNELRELGFEDIFFFEED